jgi:hypothetical protein
VPATGGQDPVRCGRLCRVPSRWSLLLDVADPARVLPEQLYGLISPWIEGHLDNVGHHAPRKPYTLSPLRPVAGRPDRHVAIDIGMLDDTLVPAILGGAEDLARSPGRLGHQAVRGLQWDSNRLGLLERAEDWDDLAEAEPAGSRFRLDLLTPTAFHSGQVYQPFPLPGLVLGHLREQWTQWGPQLEHPSIEAYNVAVETYQLRCVRLTLRGRSVVGSVGEVVYQIGSRDPTDRAAIGRWLAVLPYTALGADTRMGLGQAEVSAAGPHPDDHPDPPARERLGRSGATPGSAGSPHPRGSGRPGGSPLRPEGLGC